MPLNRRRSVLNYLIEINLDGSLSNADVRNIMDRLRLLYSSDATILGITAGKNSTFRYDLDEIRVSAAS